MPQAVIYRPLLGIGEYAVSFRGLAEMMLGLVFLFRISVRMPFQRRLAISRLDLIGGTITRDTENLVVVSFCARGHSSLLPQFSRFPAGAAFVATRTMAGRSTRP